MSDANEGTGMGRIGEGSGENAPVDKYDCRACSERFAVPKELFEHQATAHAAETVAVPLHLLSSVAFHAGHGYWSPAMRELLEAIGWPTDKDRQRERRIADLEAELAAVKAS